jgi:hypothetical protein
MPSSPLWSHLPTPENASDFPVIFDGEGLIGKNKTRKKKKCQMTKCAICNMQDFPLRQECTKQHIVINLQVQFYTAVEELQHSVLQTLSIRYRKNHTKMNTSPQTNMVEYFVMDTHASLNSSTSSTPNQIKESSCESSCAPAIKP